MSEQPARQAVVDAIQRTYGDATQTALDFTAASAAMSALREAGWFSLDEVAAIVLAAGGEVTVNMEHFQAALDDTLELLVADDFAAGVGAKKLIARKRNGDDS